MRLRDAVRRAAGYHLRALPPTAVGLGLAGAGVWYGLDGGNSLAAVTTARLAPAAVLAGLGVAVAAVGRTAVRLDANAAAVARRLDGSGIDEDDLRETVAIATERAVADSIDGATAEIEARVSDAVMDAVAGDDEASSPSASPSPSPSASPSPSPSSSSPTDPSPPAEPASAPQSPSDDASPTDDASSVADALDAHADESDALADATRRASERVESYLESEDADAGEFRQLAEGAAVLDDSESADADGADRAVVRTDGPSDAERTDEADGVSPGEAETAGDGAEILDDDPADPDLPDGDTETDDAEILDDDTEMVFGDDVRDPDET
ncbi:hypothetical protein SAMN04487947_1805 [Halogeometricum rufum]|uniref:Uncharacterized protein n=1 Tax=Halogeometricum rufum TaxID=553469 RepID=A0A1I6GY78_9EURY|nr:hypothetical protein [Halogeometricum rufum]SFR47049.1 hypothetical protein SAMN04487947_1805 [Halogeometricum rufum]